MDIEKPTLRMSVKTLTHTHIWLFLTTQRLLLELHMCVKVGNCHEYFGGHMIMLGTLQSSVQRIAPQAIPMSIPLNNFPGLMP